MEPTYMPRLVDLSHPISPGMVTYPGLPGPVLSDHLTHAQSTARYAPGTTFHMTTAQLVGNTGTYVDAPAHRFPGAADIAALPLERLAALEGVVVDAPGRATGPEAFADVSVNGRAVLVRTGWSAHFGTEAYGRGHFHLTAAAAGFLLASGAALVGIDSLNVDDTAGGERPVHTLLLRAGIPILEHLRGLEQLPREGFQLHAVPAPFRGMTSFPVRAYAVVP
ncbi:MAG TPA: cyclase family protein [Myxococcaceae bacterium]|nr:cyclase family protein [Myxococcaceae bacterium]